MTVTIWRAVVGYEGLYSVSNYGQVRRIDRTPARVLKYGHNMQGRRQVTLCKDGVPTKRQVHALVCTAFNGPCPPGLECRHGDGDHLNNYAGNLSWGTHTQNMQDKTVHGTQLLGEVHPHAKLDEQAVRTIRASVLPQRALGKLYGVSQVAIHAVRSGKTWRHVE